MTRLQLLGTGSADGWPNPFCSCASCTSLRGRGETRGHTALLVDDRLLVDLGPEVPRAAERLGVRLDGLSSVLLTHAHPDHLAPLGLLMRQWARPHEPLTVAGPPAAIAACRPWVDPTGGVTFLTLAPGDRVELSGHRVDALAARHDGPEAGPALVYRLTAPDGLRVLYATDTGPLPEATHAALARAPLDVVMLELTFGHHLDHGTDHLDLRTFPLELARLRRSGAVTADTTVVPVHLSHHNPPDLHRVVAAWGAELLHDGAVLDAARSGQASGSPRRRSPSTARRVLVLGGARSGKSAHAELLLAGEPTVTYVATGGTRAEDEAWAARVVAHRARRPQSWTTVETTDVEPLLADAGPEDALLVDCLTLWLTALLDDVDAWDDPALAHKRAKPRLDALCEAFRTTRGRVVAVSNEVGWGVVPGTPAGRTFQDLQGALNTALARQVDAVHLVVAGRAVDLATPVAQGVAHAGSLAP